jgi:uncharacterized membrane protein YjfL (UPF0719 family)
MQLSIVLWAVWGVLVLLFVIIKIYVMRLGRDEEDVLVLEEGTSQFRAEQAAIAAKLNKIEPIQRIMMWAVIVMSLAVVAYYIVDMIHQFQ